MTAPTPEQAARIVRGEVEVTGETPVAYVPVYRLVTGDYHNVATIAGHPMLDLLAHNGNAPEVLVWGERLFARGAIRQLAGGVLDLEYREVFAVAVPGDAAELWPVSDAGT